MSEIPDARKEFVAVCPGSDTRDRIPCMRFDGQIFDIAVIADRDKQRVGRLKVVKKSPKETVEILKRIDCRVHILAMTGVVRQPVFEQCEIVPQGNLPEMLTGLPGCYLGYVGVPQFRPPRTYEVCGYPLIPDELFRRENRNTRHHTR